MRPWDPVVPVESSLNEIFSLLIMVVLNIVALNVFGLRKSGKQAGLIHWIRSLPSSPEIVCLQEMHCISSEEAQAWFAASRFSVAVSPGSVRSCGCVLLFRPPLVLSSVSMDQEGRFLVCSSELADSVFCVVALYAPNCNPARNLFLNYVPTQVDSVTPKLLCGDFNTAFDRSLDRLGSDPLDGSRESFASLLRLF